MSLNNWTEATVTSQPPDGAQRGEQGTCTVRASQNSVGQEMLRHGCGPPLQLLDCCADGMVFGALKPCPQCGGQLLLRSHCYQCTGNISAWTKCTYTTDDPDREKWVIPEELMDIPDL